MQVGLFDQQEKKLKRYDGFIKQVKDAGKIAKFLHCRVRALTILGNKTPTAVLEALQDLEDIAKGVCITASEISSHRPLKMDDLDFIFISKIPFRNLSPDTSNEKCWNTFFELKNSITVLFSVSKNLAGSSKSPYIIGKEFDLSERMVDFVFGITRLGLAMRNEIPYDIQNR